MAVPCKNFKDYCTAHFDRIVAFKVPHCLTSAKGGVHMRFVNLFTHLQSMSPALNRRSVVRHFKCGDAIEIYDRIIVNSYTGLPHIYLVHVGVCVCACAHACMHAITITGGVT